MLTSSRFTPACSRSDRSVQPMACSGWIPTRVTLVLMSFAINSMTADRGRACVEKRLASILPGCMIAAVPGLAPISAASIIRTWSGWNSRIEPVMLSGIVPAKNTLTPDSCNASMSRAMIIPSLSTGRSSSPIPTTAMRRAPASLFSRLISKYLGELFFKIPQLCNRCRNTRVRCSDRSRRTGSAVRRARSGGSYRVLRGAVSCVRSSCP